MDLLVHFLSDNAIQNCYYPKCITAVRMGSIIAD